MSADLLQDRLFIGIGGFVVCLDPGTGEELWRSRIKASGPSTVAVIGDALYGAAEGELCRLDPETGEIYWRNKLPRLGLGVISFPAGSEVAAHAQVANASRQAAT